MTEIAPRLSSKKRRRKNGMAKKAVLRITVASSVIAILIISTAIWLSFRAQQIHTNLTSAVALVPKLQEQLDAGDATAVQLTFGEMQGYVSVAHEAGTDPLWRAAAVIPFLGANLSAISEVAVSANDVINGAAGPLLDEFETLNWDKLAPVEGKIDVGPLRALSPKLSAAKNTVELSHQRLAAIDQSRLLPQVAHPLTQATDALEKLGEGLTAASSAADILPSMLGINDERHYLLLIQNSAEIRATGGIPGALALLSAHDGQLQLSAQASATELGRFDPPIISDPAQAAIYSTRMGRFMQSVNLTPDFPTAAQTAADMWEREYGGVSVDGVVALDPVALANILKATGPVEISLEDSTVREAFAETGLPSSLTAENVVQTLLSDVYAAFEDPELQDIYFAGVASEIFEALSSGSGDSRKLVESLIQSADEGRLYLWSRNVHEQESFTSFGIAGNVVGKGSGGAAFGAYFNDGTAAKMDYYIRRTVQLHRSCTPEGYLQYTMTATLVNTVSPDAAEALPAYVTGGSTLEMPAGTVQTNFVGYGPDQSQLQTARIDGEPVPLGSYRHGDRPVGVLTTRLGPGEAATVELDFTNVVQTSEPILNVTPTIQPVGEVVLPLEGDTTCADAVPER